MALDALRALASTPTKPEDDGPGWLGAITSIPGDLKDMFVGLAQLGVGAVNDIVTSPIGTAQDVATNLIPEAVTLGKFDSGDDYHTRTGQLLSKLPPAVAEDFGRRYGSLLPGGAPASQAINELQENPLSYILDALTVATAGASAAGSFGGAAVKGSEAAAAAAKEALDGLIEVGVRPRTAAAAATRTGLEALAAERPLSGLEKAASALLPAQTKALIGGQLVPTTQAYNPLTRLAISPVQKALTEPVGALESRVGALEGQIAAVGKTNVPSELISEYGYQSDLLGRVKEAGLERISKPFVSDKMADMAARRFLASTNSRFLKTRLQETSRYQAALKPLMKEAPELAQEGAGWMTGMNASLGDTPAEWFTNQEARAGIPLESRTLDLGAEAPPMRTALSPAGEVARASADPLAERTEAVVERLRAYQQRLADPEDIVHERIASADAEIDATNRIIDHLYSDLDRQLLHVGPGPETAAAGERLVGTTRLLDMEKMVDEFDSLQSTPRQVLEETYVPLRLKYGAQWDDEGVSLAGTEAQVAKVEGWVEKRAAAIFRHEDPTASPVDLTQAEAMARAEIEAGAAPKTVTEAAERVATQTRVPTVEELDDAFRASGEAAPTYFPFMNPEKLKNSDWFTAKKLVGSNIYSRDPHLNRMKGVLLMEGSYVRDPVEALTRRAARGVRAQETFRQMMDVVKEFGNPIAKTDDVPMGHVVVAPDLLFLAKRTGFKLEDTLDDLLSRGLDRDSAMAQALESVMMKNTDDIAKLIESGNVQMWAVPKVVADRLNDASRYAGFISGKTRLWHDSVIQAWRGLVLSGSPRWVVNNFLGNTLFAGMQGAKVADVVRALGAHFKEEVLGRESEFLAELRKLPGYENVPSGFVSSTVGQYEYAKPGLADSRTYRALARLGQTKPVTWAEHFGRGMRTLNGIIEESYRSASYLAAAEKQLGISAIRRTASSFMGAERRVAGIMKAGFDETRATAALNDVTHFFGDYGALGPFERHVLRRWMFPFWAFYKHQAKLLLSFPFEYPGRTKVLQALADVNNDMMEEYGPVPSWLEGALPLSPPGSQVEFLSTRGANPFSMTFEPWTGMLSPVLKVAIEQATGRSLFTGNEFTDKNVITPFGTDQRFRLQYGENGQVIGADPVERVAPGLLESVLQQVPQYDMLKDVIAGGKTYDTSTLVDALQGDAAMIDPNTGQPRYPTSLADKLAGLAGANTYDYDLGSYQQSLRQQELEAIAAALSGAQG